MNTSVHFQQRKQQNNVWSSMWVSEERGLFKQCEVRSLTAQRKPKKPKESCGELYCLISGQMKRSINGRIQIVMSTLALSYRELMWNQGRIMAVVPFNGAKHHLKSLSNIIPLPDKFLPIAKSSVASTAKFLPRRWYEFAM